MSNINPHTFAYTPALFTQYCTKGRWIPAEFLLKISDALALRSRGSTNKNIMINCPPRHGKTFLTSEHFPAWYLGNFPDRRVILTSYGDRLARNNGGKARNILTEFGYSVFGVTVSSKSSAEDEWDIKGYTGGMKTAGVGGPITGFGAHCLIIDDPIKNAKEARSQTVKESILDWYKGVAYTRLEPGGFVVLIMTRWAEDDLAGSLLKEESEKWEVLNFPALAGDSDILGRNEGEALFPERYPVEVLLDIKRTTTAYWFNSQFLQRPTPDEGTKFKEEWWQEYEYSEGVCDLGNRVINLWECFVFFTWDPAGSLSKAADYYAICVWFYNKGTLLKHDMAHGKKETYDQIDEFERLYKIYKPSKIVFGSKGLGLSTYQMLKQKGYPIEEAKEDTDKVLRSDSASILMRNGLIYVNKDLPKKDIAKTEITNFPYGAHDDIVDNWSQAAMVAIDYNFDEVDDDYSNMLTMM